MLVFYLDQPFLPKNLGTAGEFIFFLNRWSEKQGTGFFFFFSTFFRCFFFLFLLSLFLLLLPLPPLLLSSSRPQKLRRHL